MGDGDGPAAGRTVRTATARQVLTACPHPEGGLRVEVFDQVRGHARVDDDVVALMRAVTRQLAADPAGTHRFAREVATLAAVDVAGAGPVESVLRAAYPLLGAVAPWPVPALPGVLPPALQPAFRSRDPRSAARLLFGPRATRPVVRALAGALTASSGTIDLFRLTLAVAVAGRLEPDHLVRVLQAPAGRARDRSPLEPPATEVLADLLVGVPTRRLVALLTSAVASGDDRTRVRHVLDAADRGLPVDLVAARSWREASTAVALADPDVDAALPTGGAQPDLPDHPDWELRPARTGHDLVRLSEQLDNCLDTYVGRLGPDERIVEVVDRHDGRPAYAVHLRRGHVVEFRGRHNRTPAATIQREVDALLDAHDRFRDPDATVRVEIADRSLRRLATRWLAPRPGDEVEWVELGTAFWLAGLLRELPDPERPAGERVVGDLAELAVAGRLQEVPRRAPGPADLAAAERQLADGTTPRTRAGQQRRAMLAVVREAVHRGRRPSRHGHGRQ